MKSETITVRLDVGTKARIDATFGKLPYQPTLTAIIERGIDLAIKEAEAIGSIAKPRQTSISDRQYLEKIADQVIARNQTETAEAPAKKLDGGSSAASRGAGGVASACPALIDDVGGE
ncbi:hypothetical protein [Rhizobium rhizogenes]|uniref:hypothetical protein n=1 Tax=Rhizobium rhizogenes TaxID=359 RepID=UPI00226F0A8A|nr:hypothetical protein [Rhizobium rhizogenes]